MVALIGGLVGLDGTSFPQAMISRPLVAGALTGAVFGRPTEGVVLGFLLEAFALVILPIGAVRYPESGTAAVAGASAYVAAVPGGLDAAALILTLAFALGWEYVGGASIVMLRRTNGRLLAAGSPVSASELERRHLAAMAVDFLRGSIVSAGGGLLAYGLVRVAQPFWSLPDHVATGALDVVAAGMVGTAAALFGGVRSRRLVLVAGAIVGVLVGWVLP